MAKGLTLEEHRDFGARLGSLRDELVILSVGISNAYHQKLCDDLDAAIKNIDAARSNLDDILCKEHPELSNAIILNIYYGDLSETRSIKGSKKEAI